MQIIRGTLGGGWVTPNVKRGVRGKPKCQLIFILLCLEAILFICFVIFQKVTRHTGRGKGTEQCHQMSQGEGMRR